MSAVFFKSSRPVAKKEYFCDACRCVNDGWNQADIDLLTVDEKAAYELAKSHGFKVLAGEVYVKQPQVYDGYFTTFRGIPAMVDICHKYELFDTDY